MSPLAMLLLNAGVGILNTVLLVKGKLYSRKLGWFTTFLCGVGTILSALLVRLS